MVLLKLSRGLREEDNHGVDAASNATQGNARKDKTNDQTQNETSDPPVRSVIGSMRMTDRTGGSLVSFWV